MENRVVEKRCDICLDQQCDGRKDCTCDTCKNRATCYKVLSPTIRITTKCTQACRHCCFESSPKRTEMMSVETAKKINLFLHANGINRMNIMGGEFFCNPDWYEVIDALMKDIPLGRLVSNGDWVISKPTTEKFMVLAKNRSLKVSISEDQWHTNANVEAAVRVLRKHKINHNTPTAEETTENGVVPIGRSLYTYGIYGMFGTYCSNPPKRYSFLIDEDGDVFKCVYGIWNYANIEEYLTGGFRKRFKKVGDVFHKTFIASCKDCIMIHHRMPVEENHKVYKVGDLKRVHG